MVLCSNGVSVVYCLLAYLSSDIFPPSKKTCVLRGQLTETCPGNVTEMYLENVKFDDLRSFYELVIFKEANKMNGMKV